MDTSIRLKSFPTTLWTVVLRAGQDEPRKPRPRSRSFVRATGILFTRSFDGGGTRRTTPKI